MQASIFRNGLGSQYGNGTLFFSVSVPLSAWWETAHKIKEHNLEIEQARLQQEHTNELLHMRAQQAHNQMNEASLLINEYENALQLATQNYNLTQADYQAGRVTISQLLEAQTVLLQAQNNLTDAFISYRIAERKFLNYQHWQKLFPCPDPLTGNQKGSLTLTSEQECYSLPSAGPAP